MKFTYPGPYRQEHLDRLTSIRTHNVPRALSVLAIIVILFLGAAAAFMTFVPWIQSVSGAGAIVTLDPADREQPISALVPGRVAEWMVRDGSRVKRGDLIARIVDNDDQLVDRLTTQLSQAQSALDAARSAASTARLDADRKARLFNDGLVARIELEQAQIKLAELEANAQSAAQAFARAEVALSREGSQDLRAPRDGLITRVVSGGTATYVQAGDVLARFIPDEVTRVVELYVDGRDAALIDAGRRVQLQFDGWPVVQFSGWPSIAIGTFAGEVQFVEPQARTGGRFRVVVTELPEVQPWPSGTFLRLGTRVNGWVLLDEVSVGYELWRRLNTFPPEWPEGLNGVNSVAEGASSQ